MDTSYIPPIDHGIGTEGEVSRITHERVLSLTLFTLMYPFVLDVWFGTYVPQLPWRRLFYKYLHISSIFHLGHFAYGLLGLFIMAIQSISW